MFGEVDPTTINLGPKHPAKGPGGGEDGEANAEAMLTVNPTRAGPLVSQDKGLVLVTGTTGFLGPYVVAALARAGWRVRAATRQGPVPSEAHEQVVVGDISADTDWGAALEGVDAVVHLAGLAHQDANDTAPVREAYFRINTEGTLKLARAAAERVRQFLFVSTILVNGSNTNRRPPFCEDDVPSPQSIYAQSKAAAEQGLASIGSNSRVRITILRPPLIYGRGAKGNFARLCRAVRNRIPLPLGAVRNRRAFVGAENQADFITHCIEPQSPRTGVLIIADREQVSTADFVRLTAKAMSRSVLLPSIPEPLLRATLRMVGASQSADSLLNSLEIDLSKAHASGWVQKVSLREGLKRAVTDSIEFAAGDLYDLQ